MAKRKKTVADPYRGSHAGILFDVPSEVKEELHLETLRNAVPSQVEHFLNDSTSAFERFKEVIQVFPKKSMWLLGEVSMPRSPYEFRIFIEMISLQLQSKKSELVSQIMSQAQVEGRSSLVVEPESMASRVLNSMSVSNVSYDDLKAEVRRVVNMFYTDLETMKMMAANLYRDTQYGDQVHTLSKLIGDPQLNSFGPQLAETALQFLQQAHINELAFRDDPDMSHLLTNTLTALRKFVIDIPNGKGSINELESIVVDMLESLSDRAESISLKMK
jgi:hypothetical protein